MADLKVLNIDGEGLDVPSYQAGAGITINSDVISASRNPSNTYTKAEVDSIVAGIGTTSFEVVQVLPQVGDPSTIYLLDNGDDSYDQYVYTNGEWAHIGAGDYVPQSGGTFNGNVTIDRADGVGGGQGTSILTLGNNATLDTDGNSRGAIRLYEGAAEGANSFYTQIQSEGITANRQYYLKRNGDSIIVAKANDASPVGSGTNPVYVSSTGGVVASTSTVGSANGPVYLSGGKITACTTYANATVGTANKLGTSTVGSGARPIYLSAGTATASSSTVGSSSRPVYLSSGTLTQMSDWFNQSVKTTAEPTFKHLYIGSGHISKTSGELVLQSGSAAYGVFTYGAGLTVERYAGGGVLAPCHASAFDHVSSKKVKENIVPMNETEARKILEVEAVNFDYIEAVGGAKGQHGVIAEDVYKIIPAVVTVPEDYDPESTDVRNTLGVDYSKFVPYLIKMVQVQQKQIIALKEALKV